MNSAGRRITKIGLASLLGLLALGFIPTARAVDGTEVFTNNCAACHGPDGKARNPRRENLE